MVALVLRSAKVFPDRNERLVPKTVPNFACMMAKKSENDPRSWRSGTSDQIGPGGEGELTGIDKLNRGGMAEHLVAAVDHLHSDLRNLISEGYGALGNWNARLGPEIPVDATLHPATPLEEKIAV